MNDENNMPSIPSKENYFRKEEVKMNGEIVPLIPSIPSIENGQLLQLLDTARRCYNTLSIIISHQQIVIYMYI